MALVTIPKGYREGFKFLFELSEHERNQLISELKTVPYDLSSDDLEDQIKNTLNIEWNKLDEILRSLTNILYVKDMLNLDANSIVSEIISALNRTEDNALRPPPDFELQLKALVNLEESNFYIKKKATKLAVERDKILINTRIITDIRPVMTEDIDCKIKANLILHTLKIEYSERGQIKEHYFGLDESDLKKLKEHIERAELKENIIREELKKTDAKIIDYK